jgi:hypothetical protein
MRASHSVRQLWDGLPRLAGNLAIATLFLFALLANRTSIAQKKQPPVTTGYGALIERATEHEVQALESPTPFEFQERLRWDWGSETRSVIETPKGRADRIILFRDEPLSPEQQAKQKRRLEKLLVDRSAVKDELQDQKAEIQRRIKVLKAFSKAFFFDFAGREHGLLRFNFHPNPDFSPKDRETQMYKGMEGSAWLEPVQERLVRIEGTLVKDVSFGWGILGHLNKGGVYVIAQTQVSPGSWRITTLNVDVKGRTFLVNSFHFLREEINTHLRPTPPGMTYREAVETLLSLDDQDANARSAPSTRHRPSEQHANR